MVLVTGGTGLVGAHLLIHLLEKGENVRALYRNSESTQKTKALFSLYQKNCGCDSAQATLFKAPALADLFVRDTITNVINALEGGDDFFIMRDDNHRSFIFARHIVQNAYHRHGAL